jgi:hypothetical protein
VFCDLPIAPRGGHYYLLCCDKAISDELLALLNSRAEAIEKAFSEANRFKWRKEALGGGYDALEK